MVTAGIIIAVVGLIGILVAYFYAEAKTPGFGWKKQVEEPAEEADRQLQQAGPANPR